MFLCGWRKRKNKRSTSTNQSDLNKSIEEPEQTESEYGSMMAPVELNNDTTESFKESMFVFFSLLLCGLFCHFVFHRNRHRTKRRRRRRKERKRKPTPTPASNNDLDNETPIYSIILLFLRFLFTSFVALTHTHTVLFGFLCQSFSFN